MDCLPDSAKNQIASKMPEVNSEPIKPLVNTPSPSYGSDKVMETGLDGIYRTEYGSIEDAVNCAFEDYGVNDHKRQLVNSKLHKLNGTYEFLNKFTKQSFLNELTNPSAKLRNAVEAMKEHIIGDIDAPQIVKRKVKRGQEFGDEVDSDRFLARNFNCWDQSVKQASPQKTVTIGCNISVLAERDPEDLIYRGAACMALADILNERGYAVEIIGYRCCTRDSYDKTTYVCKTMIKHSDMPMEINSVIFSLCEIAFVRVCYVYGMQRRVNDRDEWGGTTCDIPDSDKSGIDYLIEQDIWSQNQAVNWIKQQLSKTE